MHYAWLSSVGEIFFFVKTVCLCVVVSSSFLFLTFMQCNLPSGSKWREFDTPCMQPSLVASVYSAMNATEPRARWSPGMVDRINRCHCSCFSTVDLEYVLMSAMMHLTPIFNHHMEAGTWQTPVTMCSAVAVCVFSSNDLRVNKSQSTGILYLVCIFKQLVRKIQSTTIICLLSDLLTEMLVRKSWTMEGWSGHMARFYSIPKRTEFTSDRINVYCLVSFQWVSLQNRT